MAKTRRDTLRELGCALLTRTAFVTGAERLFLMNSLAGPAAAQGSPYKALVCIFLFGGNDANNMVVPYDDYFAVGGYRDTRNPNNDGTGIGIQQNQLLQISVPSAGATFGLHPSLAEIQSLYSAGKVAIAVNVGTLFQPVTRSDYQNNPKVRPYQLFSHSDQQTEWQTSYANSPYPTGWAGRVSDVFGIDPSGFPTISSVAGVTIFSAGRSTRPIVLPSAPTALSASLKLKRNGDDQPGSALTDILGFDADPASPSLISDTGGLTQQAIANSIALKNANPTISTVFPNTSIGNQLLQVAKLIKVCSDPTQIGIQRQIFFCSLGGFDTHNNQGNADVNSGAQPRLLAQLSQAMNAFYNATVELSVSSQVTTFTMSDFSRTLVTGGSGAATGTDHAWGSHHLVMGDGVNGGDFYGTYPTLAKGGPDDTDGGSSPRGRWIPTTAVDQYAATMARWFGVSNSDLSGTVFPNLGNFANSDLGFMNSGAGMARRR